MIQAKQPSTASANGHQGAGPRLSVVTMVNDEQAYRLSRETLEHQLDARDVQWIAIRPSEHGWGAAASLNHGIDRAEASWVVCVHQDVLFPDGWWDRVEAQLDTWEGAPIGVAGLLGRDANGERRGHLLDAHGYTWLGPLPAPVLTLDEHLLIVRKDEGLRFDPDTPGFHVYGSDLCLEARRRGLAAVVLDAPVVHLSPGHIDASYHRAAAWLVAKWRGQVGGAIPTPARILYDRGWRGWGGRLRFKLTCSRAVQCNVGRLVEGFARHRRAGAVGCR